MTIDRLSLYTKYRVFLCFGCKSFANWDYSALIFNYEKAHRISKFSIKPFRTIGIRYLSVFLLNLKLTIMFNWKYNFVRTFPRFSVISIGAISINAWQGLKSWYTITMAFGLASQAQAKNRLKGQCFLSFFAKKCVLSYVITVPTSTLCHSVLRPGHSSRY